MKQTAFKSWNEFENEIEHLFGTAQYGAKPEDIGWLKKVVAHIKENVSHYQQNPHEFNQFVTTQREYLENMASWMPYLSGGRACLINMTFVDKDNQPVEKALVSKALKEEHKENASHIFIQFSVEPETLKILNSTPRPKM